MCVYEVVYFAYCENTQPSGIVDVFEINGSVLANGVARSGGSSSFRNFAPC